MCECHFTSRHLIFKMILFRKDDIDFTTDSLLSARLIAAVGTNTCPEL